MRIGDDSLAVLAGTASTVVRCQRASAVVVEPLLAAELVIGAVWR